MRRARYKSEENAFYHILTRVAGSRSFYPLQQPEARQKLIDMLYLYVQVYCCVLVSFEIMGSHYHFILWMQKFRRLSRRELERRAFLLWGSRAKLKTASWSDEKWTQFNRKLFDLSAFMQHLNGEYAKWYNRRYDRRGHFWADRFKNPQLLGLRALQACILYIETNATRAQLVDRPEQWKPSSAWLRWQNLDEHLMPIEQIFRDVSPEEAFETYRQRLEGRHKVDIRVEIPGEHPDDSVWTDKRHRFFSDGIAVGSEPETARIIESFRETGHYRRRKNPVPQLSGYLFTVREQRSHARNCSS